MENPTKTLMHLTQIEEQAQEILTDRQEIVALDKQRNQNREAIRTIQKQDETSAWITVGPLLVKMPVKKVSDILNKGKVLLSNFPIEYHTPGLVNQNIYTHLKEKCFFFRTSTPGCGCEQTS